MKSKFLLFTLLILINTAIDAQKLVYPKPNTYQILFGKKLLAPASLNFGVSSDHRPYTSGNVYPGQMNDAYRPFIPLSGNNKPAQGLSAQKNTPSGFHLTKDINTHMQPFSSYPNNNNIYEVGFFSPFAVLNNVSYFAADDGVHGSELWRSDGSPDGTYMVKDINPGTGSSLPTSIIVVNNKLYFSVNADADGWQPYVSDGTAAGTNIIINIGSEIPHIYAEGFVKVNNSVFFTTNSDHGSAVWKTDGTPEGTSLVYDFNVTDPYAGYVTEATAVNGLLFFSAWTPALGRELWRSDGTVEGTYLVKDIGPDQSDYYSPLQLTEYNNELYFSGDDGTGRKLWVSDGTADGTHTVADNNILVQTDFLNYGINVPFPVLNNVLYLAGYSFSDGNGLYKYDASNADGIVLVKDLTPDIDVDFIVPNAFIRVGNALYFKAINSIGGYHDDL